MTKTLSRHPLAFFVSSVLLSASAFAANVSEPTGYLTDSRGSVVMTGNGLCVETATPQIVHYSPECGKRAPEAPSTSDVRVADTSPATTLNTYVEPMKEAKADTIMTLRSDALFDFDKAVLKPAGKMKIDSDLHKLGPSNLRGLIGAISVSGHTDSVGTDNYNAKLGQRRACAIKNYLVSLGVPAEQIMAISFGEKRPVATNKTAEGRAQNRRVEIEFTTK